MSESYERESSMIRHIRVPDVRTIALVTLLAVLAACGRDADQLAGPAGGDHDCGTFSAAVLDEDSHRMIFHAMQEGVVESELISDVDLNFLQIPGLIQATGTDQYDIVQTSLVGIPRAREAGADLRLVAPTLVQAGEGSRVFVRADSDIQDAHDLKGRTLGVPSLGSTAATLMRLALIEGFGIDAVLEDGEIEFVELAPQPLVGALDQGNVDAALLYHRAGFEARDNDSLRVLFNVDDEYEAVAGALPISAGLVALGSQVDGREECYVEFRRLMTESRDYAIENDEEVAEQVAEEHGSDAEFLVDWIRNQYDFAGTLEPQYLEMVEALWEIAHRNGEIPSVPDIEEILVRGDG